MLKIKKRSSKNKKILLLGLAAALIIAGGALYAFANQSDDPQTETVNLDPSTRQDAKRVEENKQRIVEKESQENSQAAQPGNNKQTVKPIITYADQYGQAVEVGAYVTVFEDNGACTATFTNAGQSIKKTVNAVRNANTTNCPVMTASSNEFSPKGNWSVVVSYDSPTSSGQSDAKIIEIK